jgi:hypothetical protein
MDRQQFCDDSSDGIQPNFGAAGVKPAAAADCTAAD